MNLAIFCNTHAISIEINGAELQWENESATYKLVGEFHHLPPYENTTVTSECRITYSILN